MIQKDVFGIVFWSDYFKSRCVVVNYKHDDHWHFVVENRPWKVLKAQTNYQNVMQERWKYDR